MNALEKILEAHKLSIDKLNTRLTALEVLVARLQEELDNLQRSDGLIDGEEIVG